MPKELMTIRALVSMAGDGFTREPDKEYSIDHDEGERLIAAEFAAYISGPRGAKVAPKAKPEPEAPKPENKKRGRPKKDSGDFAPVPDANGKLPDLEDKEATEDDE
jgi:hypothetical protein